MKTDMGAAAEMALERTTRPRSQSHADATDDLSPLHRLTDDERSTFRSCSSLPDAQVRQTADLLLSHPLNTVTILVFHFQNMWHLLFSQK